MSLTSVLVMMLMAYAQNISFSIVSRSRNRNHVGYHLIAAIASNAVWFMTMKYLIVTQNMGWGLMIPYTIGTVSGSVTGQKISMWIEKLIGAKSE